MRVGNHTMYATMPFVGGYIEKCFYSELCEGDRNILEGRTSAWGSKALGIVQTSDCREARAVQEGTQTRIDFVDLGRWSTWVKWAELDN